MAKKPSVDVAGKQRTNGELAAAGGPQNDPQNDEHPALRPRPGAASWVLYRLRSAESRFANAATGEPTDGEDGERAKPTWETCMFNIDGQVITRWDVRVSRPTYGAICSTWGSGTYRVSWFSPSGQTMTPGQKLRIDDPRFPPRPAYPNPPRLESPPVAQAQSAQVATEPTSNVGDLLAQALAGFAAAPSTGGFGLSSLITLLPIGFQIWQQMQAQTRAEEAMRFERLRQEERMIFERARQQDEARMETDRQHHIQTLERIRLESAESMRSQQHFWTQQTRAMKELNRDPQEDLWEDMREAIDTLKDRDKGTFEKIAELAPALLQLLPKPPVPAAPASVQQ